MQEKIPLEGNINEYNLPRILISCNRLEKTGELIFERESIRKCIFFKDGKVIFASSSQDSDRLGDILLNSGMITEEQYTRAAEIFLNKKKRKGIIFVEEGYLEPKNLIPVITEQVKEIILSLFEWEEGKFRFEDSLPSDEVITIDISLKELIKEGFQRRKAYEKSDTKIFRENINSLYEKIGSLSHYERLDVNMDSKPSEIKKAYLEKAKSYHPDKHNSLSDSRLNEKLSKVISLLNESYNILKDETSRTKYDKSIFTSSRGKDSKQGITKAKENFARGVINYKEGNYWNAAEFFRWATRLGPDKAKHWSHLSMALGNIPKRAKEAEEAVHKAIELEPNNANNYVQLGAIYLKAKMKLRAIKQFEIALSWDPYNERAITELEKLKSKKSKKKKKKE